MFVPASNTQAIFQPGKGEGVILRDMPGLEQGVQKQLKVAELGVQQQQQLAQTPSLESWDADYYDYMQQIEGGRKEISTKLAKGEITPAQASIQYNRFASNIQNQAKLTKEQEKVYLDGVKVLNDDKTGVFDRELSLQNLEIYKDPRKFFDKVPGLKEQFAATGNNISLWRAEYGSKYAAPSLQYNFEKHKDEAFKDIKAVTTKEAKTSTGPNGSTIITDTEVSTADPLAAMQYHGNMVALATKGDFKATQYLKTGADFLQQNFFDKDGNYNPNVQGKRLIQVMQEKMGYATDEKGESATVNVNGITVPVTNENIKDLLLTAWTINNADAYVEKKNLETKKLVKSMNISVGGDRSKAPKGLFEGLGNMFGEWNKTQFEAIKQDFNTPELRNTPEYINQVKTSIENGLGVKGRIVQDGKTSYMQFPVPAKLNKSDVNQVENGEDLILGLNGRKGIINASVSNIKHQDTYVMLGYYDRNLNRYVIADNNYLKSGNPVEMVAVNKYNVSEPEYYAERNAPKKADDKKEDGAVEAKIKRAATQDTPPKKTVRNANDVVFDATNKGKMSLYKIYPLAATGVAQSLDKAFTIAGGIQPSQTPKNVVVNVNESDWKSVEFEE